MLHTSSVVRFFAFALLAQIVVGCGSSGESTPPPPTYTISGTVTGLSGSGLVLQNNATNSQTISANGAFSFTTQIASGSTYAVTASTQPTSPSQSCTVTNATGTVASSNINNVAVTCTTNSFAINITANGLTGFGLVLQNNGGNNLSVTANGSAAFSTSIASGAAYDIRVLTHPATPNQRCTVSNGRGTVGNAAVTTPTVACVTQIPRFAYSVDNLNSTLSVYGVDATTGQLRSRGYVVTGSSPIMAIPDPAQRFWFSLSAATATLSVYRHDDVTGDLVEVAGSPFATGGTPSASMGPSHVVVHPSGNFVYVTNGAGTNNIAAFSINSASGALTPVALSPYAAGLNPLATTIDATGAFAYVTNRGSNNIYTYTINATTGALTEVANSRVVTGAAPGVLTIHANARVAYVPNNTDGNISAFTVNPSTGILTAVAGSPFAAGVNPVSTASIHASGKFLYLRNVGATNLAGSISAYTLNQTTGVLTSINSYAIGANSARSSFDPAGKFLFVSNQGEPGNNGSLSQFSVDPTTGALTALTGVPVWPGRPYSVTVEPSGKFVYVTNAAANIHYAYSLDATTGAIALITQAASTLTGRDLPLSLAVYGSVSTPNAASFSSKYAYITNGNPAGSVGAFQIAPTTGALSLVDTASINSMMQPVASAVAQNGTTLAVASRTGNSLWFYNITATGALTGSGAGGFTTSGQPSAVALDTSGRFAYTASSSVQMVSVFTINPGAVGVSVNSFGIPLGFAMTSNGRFLYMVSDSTLGRWIVSPFDGALMAGGGVTIASGTTSFALEPTSRYAYVAGASGIAVYAIDPIDGFTPATAASTLATGLTHRAMVVDATGRFLYSANGTGNTVSAYLINQGSGALTAIGTPIAAGTNVTSITADYSGKYVYAVNQGSNTVSAYAINSTTGALTAIAGGGAASGTSANSITLMNAMQ